jgi:2-keto-4-pentenoate hydratase/2-oxohepta-3-ene-1,7-dioic acid hydratase in catechol pathway
MQLFSYKSDGKIRSARLIGQQGIDLYLAISAFLQTQEDSKFNLEDLSIDLTDLLGSGQEMLQLIENATDWVVSTSIKSTSPQNIEVVFDFDQVSLVAPIVRPGKVICIAGNYPSPTSKDAPEYPTIFLKPSGGVIGHNEYIKISPACKNVAYEVELAIVIGRQGNNLALDEVASIIAGYTLANDLGDRELEKRTSQWTSGKMFDTFTPMGPLLFTRDEFSDMRNLMMFTRVNDQIVQQSNTSQMFFDIPHLLVYLSTLTTLNPGDVVLTGSPKIMNGHPNPDYALKPGDVIEVGIEGFGSLINPIIAEDQVV